MSGRSGHPEGVRPAPLLMIRSVDARAARREHAGCIATMEHGQTITVGLPWLNYEQYLLGGGIVLSQSFQLLIFKAFDSSVAKPSRNLSVRGRTFPRGSVLLSLC